MRVGALGETGRLSDMIMAFQAARPHLERSAHPTLRPTCRLGFFAFTERKAAVTGLLTGPLVGLTPGAKGFWQATIQMAAGQAEAAKLDLRELAARSDDQELRSAVERRLTRNLADAKEVLSAAEQDVIDGIEAEMQREQAYHPSTTISLRRAPVTSRSCC